MPTARVGESHSPNATPHSPMTTLSILACTVMLLGLFAYIFWPQPHLAATVEKTLLDYLRERKEVVYESLRDLNFEHKAGKYPEDDFLVQRKALEDEAATILTEMDALSSRPAIR
ncbi:MAG: hypothetical protein ABI142_14080 [Bryocella sp.]